MSARELLIQIYLDWRNNYLTVAGYAEANGLFDQQAYDLINLARSVFESDHPEK